MNLNGEDLRYQYSWVEVGKEELYSLQLNSAAETPTTPTRAGKAAGRDLAQRTRSGRQASRSSSTGSQILLYRRKIDGSGPRASPAGPRAGQGIRVSSS